MNDALADWEAYANDSEPKLPTLIRCGLLHYEFETIHPFLDGNGRLGRLFIVFFLVHEGRLPLPLLYLSDYFDRNASACSAGRRSVMALLRIGTSSRSGRSLPRW